MFAVCFGSSQWTSDTTVLTLNPDLPTSNKHRSVAHNSLQNNFAARLRGLIWTVGARRHIQSDVCLNEPVQITVSADLLNDRPLHFRVYRLFVANIKWIDFILFRCKPAGYQLLFVYSHSFHLFHPHSSSSHYSSNSTLHANRRKRQNGTPCCVECLA